MVYPTIPFLSIFLASSSTTSKRASIYDHPDRFRLRDYRRSRFDDFINFGITRLFGKFVNDVCSLSIRCNFIIKLRMKWRKTILFFTIVTATCNRIIFIFFSFNLNFVHKYSSSEKLNFDGDLRFGEDRGAKPRKPLCRGGNHVVIGCGKTAAFSEP